MRLIDTSTFELSEFVGDKIPLYAILSHRWDDSEVTYQALRDGTWSETAGARKLRGCCAQAAKDGFQWVWIDSCCIDKTSSAELSEAINSMFQWYQRSQVCYAYLSDVTSSIDDYLELDAEFRRSEWFKRGWTLQELLAPQCLEFYNRDWVEIGTKSSLAEVVKEITGINKLFDYHTACVAQKMSWMARRDTTREEDTAYCMMGLFGVNMPTLYGEGSKAFLRLQLEILSNSEDESIFAWEGPPNLAQDSGLLAHSPKWFKDCTHVLKSRFDLRRLPHTMTNRGLRMELLIATKGAERNGERLVIAPLNCKKMMYTKRESETTTWKTICLSLLGRWDDGQVRFYTRRRGLVYDVAVADAANQNIFSRETFFFKQHEPISLGPSQRAPNILILKANALVELGFRPDLDNFQNLYDSLNIGNSITYWNSIIKEQPCLAQLPAPGEMRPLGFSCKYKPLSNSESHSDVRYYPSKNAFSMVLFFVGCSKKTGRIWIDARVIGNEKWDWGEDIDSLRTAHKTIHDLDRFSRQLPDGRIISFALKKSVYEEEPAYVVDITVDPAGKARWPTTLDPETEASLGEVRSQKKTIGLEVEC